VPLSKFIEEKERFTIAEVSQLTLVPKHTLRYWEDEAKILRPIRGNSGNRIYRKEDVETVFKIKNLLYNERYTIEGVKKYLIKDKKKSNTSDMCQEHMPNSKFLQDIKNELKHILKLLKDVT
jgi:DNA-binding transcriptional MerR regulator